MLTTESLMLLAAALRRAHSIEGVAHALVGAAVSFGFQGLRIIRVVSTAPPISWDVMARFGSGAAREDWTQAIAQTRLQVLPFKLQSPDVPVQAQAALVVPVREDERLAWAVCFLGDAPDESAESVLMLGAATHAAYATWRSFAGRERLVESELTQRETQCMELVAQGKTDSEIGQLLGIAPRTVRFHMQNVKVKLRAGTRAQAVAYHAAAH